MAVDALLKIEGPEINGESQIEGHVDEIQILSWSWGVMQSGTSSMGGGMSAGRVSMQNFTFVHEVDAASTDLMVHCCNGAHIDKMTFSVRKMGTDPLDYVVIELEQCLITTVSTGGAPGDEVVQETVTVDAAQFKVMYKEQNDQGAVEDEYEMGWNVKTNVAV